MRGFFFVVSFWLVEDYIVREGRSLLSTGCKVLYVQDCQGTPRIQCKGEGEAGHSEWIRTKQVILQVQCTPHKLRPLIFLNCILHKNCSVLKFQLYVLLTFVLMLTIFHHPRTNVFCMEGFLVRKEKMLATSQASFFFFARKLARQKVFASA